MTENLNEIIKRVIITFSTKGGVGKSTIASSVVDYLRVNYEKGQYAIFDCDSSTTSLFKHTAKKDDKGEAIFDPYESVFLINVKDPAYTDMLVNVLDDYPADIYLFDLPGGVDSAIEQRWGDGEGLIEMWQAKGYKVDVIIPVSYSVESVDAVPIAYKMFGKKVNKYYVCENRAGGLRGSELLVFESIVNSKLGKNGLTAKAFAEQTMNAEIFEMPTIFPNSYALWSYLKMDFTSAIKLPDQGKMWSSPNKRDILGFQNAMSKVLKDLMSK